ncbi:MAG: acyltransferase [Aeriscardovia sp.]|nr:acyltransferase [Aeriscardovia sp.]MBR3359908.1 acyltransferase [Lachnospiraceae bacterium]
MNQVKQNGKRIPYIDALKGLAILCVVLGHVANGQLMNPFTQTAYFFVYNIIHTFHMVLFVLLSGEVFYHAYCKETSKGGQKGRIGIQIARLSILYFLWSLILGIFRMFFAEAVNTPASWSDILLIPVKPIKLYWYLFVLVIFYLFFGIFRLAKANIWIVLSVTFLLSIGSYFLPYGLYFDLKRVLCYAFFFFAGIVLARMKEKVLSLKAQKILLMVLLFFIVLSIVLCVVFWTPARFLNDRFLVNWIIAISFSLGFYVLFQKVRWLGESKLLSYLGKHSLEIYLMHTFILSAVRYLLMKIGISAPVIHLIMGLLCGVLIPLLISFVLRKIRLYNVFFDQLKLFTSRKKIEKQ